MVDACFTGTTSRLSGAGFEAICEDLARFHGAAYGGEAQHAPLVPNPGQFNFRDGGEAHLNTPANMVTGAGGGGGGGRAPTCT